MLQAGSAHLPPSTHLVDCAACAAVASCWRTRRSKTMVPKLPQRVRTQSWIPRGTGCACGALGRRQESLELDATISYPVSCSVRHSSLTREALGDPETSPSKRFRRIPTASFHSCAGLLLCVQRSHRPVGWSRTSRILRARGTPDRYRYRCSFSHTQASMPVASSKKASAKKSAERL